MKNFKLISIVTIVVMLASFMVGCSSAADEFTAYINETSYDILQDEDDVIRKLDPNADDSTIVNQLETEVIPGYKDLIEKAKKLSFEEESIEDLNDILVEYLEEKLKMYEAYYGVYTTNDVDEIEDFSAQLSASSEKAREINDKFSDKRDKLAKEYGVELIN